MVQILARAACAGLAPLFFILANGQRAPLILVYSLSVAGVVLLEQQDLTFDFWIEATPYGSSLVVATAALLWSRHNQWRFDWASAGRGIVLLLIAVVAEWVNLALVLLAVPLFLGLFWLRRQRADAVLAMRFFVAAVLVAVHASTLPGSDVGGIVWSLDPLFRAIGNLGTEISWPVGIGLAVAALASAWVVRANREFLWGIGTLFVATVLSFDLTASNIWVIENGDHYRYFVAQTLAFTTIAGSLIGAALWQLAGSRVWRFLLLLASPLAALSAGAAKTLPVDFACRMLSTPAQNSITDAIAAIAVRTRVLFMAGGYWTVGPAVYETIRRSGRDVFAIMAHGEGAREPALAAIKGKATSTVLCVDLPADQCRTRVNGILGREQFVSGAVVETGVVDRLGKPYEILQLIPSVGG